MSSQRGNDKRTRPPKHKNITAFKNNLHDKSKKLEIVNSLQTWGLCAGCKSVIDWKIKYKKYKPLTQPKTCTQCKQKTIKRAYYTVCQPCCEQKNICGKCCKEKKIVENFGLSAEEEASGQAQLDQELKHLSERQRRSFLRNQLAGNFSDAKGSEPGISSLDSDNKAEIVEDDIDSDEISLSDNENAVQKDLDDLSL